MAEIYDFLDEHDISYRRVDHPPVFTVHEAGSVLSDLEGFATKNLFLRNKKGDRHFLVVVGHDKQVNLRGLEPLVNAEKLGFGSPERLKRYLGLEPGSVSLLGLINDQAHGVEVFIDRVGWESDYIHCHPLINTATLVLSHDGLVKFLAATGHRVNVVDIPSA
jgi:Ala-tRNA(Pro) deacylase